MKPLGHFGWEPEHESKVTSGLFSLASALIAVGSSQHCHPRFMTSGWDKMRTFLKHFTQFLISPAQAPPLGPWNIRPPSLSSPPCPQLLELDDIFPCSLCCSLSRQFHTSVGLCVTNFFLPLLPAVGRHTNWYKTWESSFFWQQPPESCKECWRWLRHIPVLNGGNSGSSNTKSNFRKL